MADADSILDWAKKNKKRIVKEYLTRYDYATSDSPSIIFMAGVPGAGKTEFANRLLPQLTVRPLHIDMDEIAQHIEDYKPKVAHLFRAGATVILERLFDQAISKRINIVMDGTLGHPKAMQNVERAIDHGYLVRIYFISPEPITAWQKTLEREAVEQRSIDSEKFIDTYFQLLDNLKQISQKFGEKVPISIVLKDENNRLKDIIESVSAIDGYITPILTKAELKAKIRL